MSVDKLNRAERAYKKMEQAAADGQFVTTYDVAEYLQVTAGTIRRWIREGHIKAVQDFPRSPFRILPSDVEAFMAAHRVDNRQP